jgi:hypothetical protein
MSYVTQDSNYYHFLESDITDIREIEYEDKALECELLKLEIISYREEANLWKNLYDNAIQSIINYAKH